VVEIDTPGGPDALQSNERLVRTVIVVLVLAISGVAYTTLPAIRASCIGSCPPEGLAASCGSSISLIGFTSRASAARAATSSFLGHQWDSRPKKPWNIIKRSPVPLPRKPLILLNWYSPLGSASYFNSLIRRQPSLFEFWGDFGE
jgi:hypothetical protein